MKFKILLFLICLVCSVGLSSATSTYDIATNIITVVDGINYPWTVYSDVSNTTAFNRTGNESIMTANMSISLGATLYINGETFKFSCSSNSEYGIDSVGILNIDNSTITVTDTNYRSNGIYCHGGEHRLNITDSELSYLGYKYGTRGIYSVYLWNKAYYSNISGNTIHDCNYMELKYHLNSTTINNNIIYNVTGYGILCSGDYTMISGNTIYDISAHEGGDSFGIHSWSRHATIIGNRVYNIREGSTAGIIPKETYNVTMRDNIVNNCDIGMYAAYFSWGLEAGNTVVNNTIYNCGTGMVSGGELESVNITDNKVYDCGTGLYITESYNHTCINNIWRDSNIGIKISLHGTNGTTLFINESIYNNTLRGVSYEYHSDIDYPIIFRDSEIYNSTQSDIYFMHPCAVKFTMINTNFSTTTFNNDNNSILSYYYTDVLVQNSVSQGINNATVTFENTVNPMYPSIDINAHNQSSFTTKNNGHTDLPNETVSVVLLDTLETLSGITYMEWTISADADEYNANNSAITELNLTSGYYRSEPDTYQNTSVIVLSGWSPNANSTYDGTYRYYTDSTRIRIGDTVTKNNAVIFTNNIKPVVS